MSDELPTATGTTIVTSRVGQSCACAPPMLAHVVAIARARSNFPIFPSRVQTRLRHECLWHEASSKADRYLLLRSGDIPQGRPRADWRSALATQYRRPDQPAGPRG